MLKKSLLALVVVCFGIAFFLPAISKSCDAGLKSKTQKIFGAFDAGEIALAMQLLEKAEPGYFEVPADECIEHFGNLAEVACYGGKVLYASIEASPLYCPWLGAGPATFSIQYNEDNIVVNVGRQSQLSFLHNGYSGLSIKVSRAQ